MSVVESLQQGIRQLDLEVSPAQQAQLLDYLALLQKWNKVYNLTAIRDPEQMVSHHLLDSLVVVPHLWSGRWLDVGCGAGLPSVVLAIMRPEWSVVALDSNSKKTGFVRQAAIALGLKNLQVENVRVESWQPQHLFDGIISRAFTELANFLETTQHLLAANGRWAAMKGDPAPELLAVSSRFEVQSVIELQVPQLDAKRSLVLAAPAGSGDE